MIAAPNPFVAEGWQRAWWQHFGTGELEVLELGDVGVAALQRHGNVVRFLGNREVTDYPGAAITPGREREAAALLVGRLRPDDSLEGDNLQAAFADALEGAARAAGRRVTRATDEPVAILTLPRSWDEYLAGLHKHMRHELTRKRRRAHDARVRSADADTFAADLERFFAFLRSARGAKGRFLTVPIERFLREALTPSTARLDVLEADGRPLAATVGFQGPRTYHLYNMGYDPAAARLSPGIVLLTALIERAIDEQQERFDFMRGLEHYKLQFGARPSSLINIRVSALHAAVSSGR
jgi:CelD/BcsL family acetyltransferase involved in cellulose biosynthesis